ncbi:M15 family metallopeptidase [Auritidibacter ignavus]|uniref:M15 family metallopeptidase n=1 Tax=Auritidibacter ignavus TaxID=678932 RepID=UPI000D7322D0|nr:M15 family metallopeptidase [Auritidibacter ignavus]PXA78080.1 D-alanyl-D-alanine carboxypeptidase [Auritidibacter sp. NML120779]WGH90785.1 M15 family metallopeptidase [Auritidibacter ignavus]
MAPPRTQLSAYRAVASVAIVVLALTSCALAEPRTSATHRMEHRVQHPHEHPRVEFVIDSPLMVSPATGPPSSREPLLQARSAPTRQESVLESSPHPARQHSILHSSPRPLRQQSIVEPSAVPTAPGPSAGTASESSPTSPSRPEPTETTTVEELDHQDPASIHVMVNKHHPLEPIDYAPEDLVSVQGTGTSQTVTLRQEAATALEELMEAATDDEVTFSLLSGYRSYERQNQLHRQYVASHGTDQAEHFSARPGYSEHQTGLAVDVAGENHHCVLSACFGETVEGQWLVDHAAEHGWVIRYPQDSAELTGYAYEPWHLRYVGKEQAEAIVDAGGIAETAWGFEAATTYPEESH